MNSTDGLAGWDCDILPIVPEMKNASSRGIPLADSGWPLVQTAGSPRQARSAVAHVPPRSARLFAGDDRIGIIWSGPHPAPTQVT
jgi:hypothetical protein